jgi:PAS domain-containing protein
MECHQADAPEQATRRSPSRRPAHFSTASSGSCDQVRRGVICRSASAPHTTCYDRFVRWRRAAALESQSELSANQLQIASVLESTTDSVLVLDREWRIVFFNRRAAETIGGANAIVLGADISVHFRRYALRHSQVWRFADAGASISRAAGREASSRTARHGRINPGVQGRCA